MRKKKSAKIKKKPRSDTSSKGRKKVAVKKARARKNAAPKTRNHGTFTEAAFWQFIRGALRQKSRWWKPRLVVLEQARRPNQSTNRRLKWEFRCAHCGNWFPQSQVEVNHIVPSGALNCSADLAGFIERLFVEVDGLEVVCKSCHIEHHKKEKNDTK